MNEQDKEKWDNWMAEYVQRFKDAQECIQSTYPFIQPEDDEETKMLKLGQQLLIDAQLEK